MWCLGCALERDRKNVVLCVSKKAFIESVVSEYEINAKSDLPASQSKEEMVFGKPVRAAVGSLIRQRGMTGPDIITVVGAVVRRACDPAERHWRDARKIITYLNKTKDLGLQFVKDDDPKLSVYVCRRGLRQ